MTHRAEWLGPEAGCRTVLDYGCGSGVLALAALTLAGGFTGLLLRQHYMPWTMPCAVPALCHSLCHALCGTLWSGEPAVRAHATDVNEAALVSAARNAALNGHSDRLSLWMPWELPRAVR